jgi:TetR/AcrR family transcriptional regulator, mexCD-oprJ operon repressor
MFDTMSPHPREAIAERNLQAILDGAERLLARHESPSISAVATEAGVSRPTVYAHFPDRRRLLEALVARTVERVIAAVESAEPERGPASDAAARLIAVSWEHLARHQDMAAAAAAELPPDAMRRAHRAARGTIRALVQRGRAEGMFRTDLPVDWLVTAALALIHGAAEEVRAGSMASERAREVLVATVQELLAGAERTRGSGVS